MLIQILLMVADSSLGVKTLDPNKLKELIKSKFDDALRSVSVKFEMVQLYEERTKFVNSVQETVSEDLAKNGLELETVSITSLDQTSIEFFNDNNAFDAEGKTALVKIIESKKKERNEIEADNRVAIEKKNFEANKESLDIAKDDEFNKLSQEKDISIQRVTEQTNMEKQIAEQTRISDEAKIEASRKVQEATITSEQKVAEATIIKEQTLETKGIESEKTVQTATIEKEKAIETATITKTGAVEEAKIKKDQTVEIATQNKSIAVNKKSEEDSKAKTGAEVARGQAVTATEKVETGKVTEIATRNKDIAVIKATELADVAATGIKVAAAAEKTAAGDKADAIKTKADASAYEVTTGAKATDDLNQVIADGIEKKNKAENTLSVQLIEMRLKELTITTMPEIIKESVKPMEAISEIKIMQVEGLGIGGSNMVSNNSGNGDGNKVLGTNNLSEQVVQSALQYRAATPMLDGLMSELGLKEGLGIFGAPAKSAKVAEKEL